MNADNPAWVDQAARLPVAFAQVREDPLLDQWVVQQLNHDAQICMVASGGCTAAFLSTAKNVGSIHLVDPNPAQLALAQLKLRLIAMRSLQDLSVADAAGAISAWRDRSLACRTNSGAAAASDFYKRLHGRKSG